MDLTGLRGRLAAGVTIGGWCAIPSSLTAEAMALSGYDWICVDTQHGPIMGDTLLPMLQAIDGNSTHSLVRVPMNEPSTIMRALDAGADGVIVPMVESAEQAAAAVSACRYPPHGVRSYSPTRSSWRPGRTPRTEDGRLACVVMIETDEAIRNVAAIAGTPGLDAVFVGPSDLAFHTIGDPEAADDVRVAERMSTVVAEAGRAGIAAGVFCGSAEFAAHWMSAGYQMIALESDLRLLRASAKGSLEQLRAMTGL